EAWSSASTSSGRAGASRRSGLSASGLIASATKSRTVSRICNCSGLRGRLDIRCSESCVQRGGVQASRLLLLLFPRKRELIFQSRWSWVPACAGTTVTHQPATISLSLDAGGFDHAGPFLQVLADELAEPIGAKRKRRDLLLGELLDDLRIMHDRERLLGETLDEILRRPGRRPR